MIDTVYTVWYESPFDDNDYLEGIFTTEDLAQAWIDKHVLTNYDRYRIQTWILDSE